MVSTKSNIYSIVYKTRSRSIISLTFLLHCISTFYSCLRRLSESRVCLTLSLVGLGKVVVTCARVFFCLYWKIGNAERLLGSMSILLL